MAGQNVTGQNGTDKISRTKWHGQNVMGTKCQRTKCHGLNVMRTKEYDGKTDEKK